MQFTPPGAGGRVTVRTKLTHPAPAASSASGSDGSTQAPTQPTTTGWSTDATACEEGLSIGRLEGHNTAMMQTQQQQRRQEPLQNGEYDPHTSPHGMPARSGRSSRGQRSVVVRIEVHDTGVGIKPRDMIDNRVSIGDGDHDTELLPTIDV